MITYVIFQGQLRKGETMNAIIETDLILTNPNGLIQIRYLIDKHKNSRCEVIKCTL